MKKSAELLRTTFPSIRFSSVYRTKAMEVEAQDDFLNAVAQIETDHTPEEVFKLLQSIEQKLKKNAPFRYGPRTIDLDLLLYDDVRIDTPALTIPHLGMHGRRFVLEPLLELINPENHHPLLKKTWEELFSKVLDQKSKKVDILL